MSGSGRLYYHVAKDAFLRMLFGIRSCAPATSHPLAHEISVSDFQTHTPLVIFSSSGGYVLGIVTTFFFFVHA